jgi:hypothetical protein
MRGAAANNQTNRDSTAFLNHGVRKDANASGSGQISGKIGYAGGFDGYDDFVDCGTNASARPAGAFTASGWFKVSDNDPYFPLMAWGESLGSAAPSVHCVFSAAGDLSLTFLNSNNSRYFNTSSSTVWDGQWHHVAFVVAGGATNDILSATAYIDGVLLGNGTTTYTGGQASKVKCKLGTTRENAGYATGFAKGGIDEARLANTPRSQAWIQAEHETARRPGEHLSLHLVEPRPPRGTVILLR